MHNVQRIMPIRVDCYADHRGEESPYLLFLNDREVKVVKILDRWLAPDHRYFKIRGADGAVYIIQHDVYSDSWELTMFDSTL